MNYPILKLFQIVTAVTSSPAKAIRRENSLGSLAVGKVADLTIFKVAENGQEMAEDAFGVQKKLKKIIIPVAALRNGKLFMSDI